MKLEIAYLTEQPEAIQAIAGLVLMVLLAYGARLVVHWILLHGFSRWIEAMQARWTRVVLHRNVLNRLEKVTPSLVVQMSVAAIPYLPAAAVSIIRNVAVAVTVLQIVRVLMAFLDALHEEHERSAGTLAVSTRSIKSHIQLAKLGLMLLGGIVIIAALIDRSPLILLSGLGAMSAVLMLVFKDTLLSFTAGLQLASNDMLRVGDWIEMPQLGADGDVIDIALHTVKVQNSNKSCRSLMAPIARQAARWAIWQKPPPISGA